MQQEIKVKLVANQQKSVSHTQTLHTDDFFCDFLHELLTSFTIKEFIKNCRRQHPLTHAFIDQLEDVSFIPIWHVDDLFGECLVILLRILNIPAAMPQEMHVLRSLYSFHRLKDKRGKIKEIQRPY